MTYLCHFNHVKQSRAILNCVCFCYKYLCCAIQQSYFCNILKLCDIRLSNKLSLTSSSVLGSSISDTKHEKQYIPPRFFFILKRADRNLLILYKVAYKSKIGIFKHHYPVLFRALFNQINRQSKDKYFEQNVTDTYVFKHVMMHIIDYRILKK